MPRDAALAILRHAARAGVNHIDTAHFYGSCNALIREALAPYPGIWCWSARLGQSGRPTASLFPAQRPEQLRDQVEANLTTLGVEQVGVVNLRRLDARPGLIAEGDQQVGLDDQLAELSALRDAGKIGALGLSSVSARQLRQALPAGIACVQNSYGVLDRAAEPVLELCRGHGIAWVPFFPLGSAFPNRPKATDDPTVAGHRRRPGRRPRPGGAGLAAGPLRQHAADPRHLRSRPSGREHRGRKPPAARGLGHGAGSAGRTRSPSPHLTASPGAARGLMVRGSTDGDILGAGAGRRPGRGPDCGGEGEAL